MKLFGGRVCSYVPLLAASKGGCTAAWVLDGDDLVP